MDPAGTNTCQEAEFTELPPSLSHPITEETRRQIRIQHNFKMSGDFGLGVHGNMSQQEGSTMGLGRADRRTLVLLGQVLALGRHRAFMLPSPAHSTFSGSVRKTFSPIGTVVNGHGSTVARNPTILKGRTRPIIDTIAWGDILFGTIYALVSKPLQNIASSLQSPTSGQYNAMLPMDETIEKSA
uniref:Uncharacterized protein n=1 Tax=Coccidioides posadasii RMSCC 3488 TaxID=454284 RepID=A0A0J6FK43_COCPO|nr:hypothetical protein CPAG_05520 [Coccidioides posadasii RMSCC 3488]